MQKKNHKLLKSLTNNNTAVAGIIVAVMIVGLVISIISIIQTIYIPGWMHDREAEHMNQVANQFSQLKHSIDTIVTTKSTIPVTNFITLGSKELGFLSSSRSFGHLQIISGNYELSISHEGGSNTILLQSIQYVSENAYFLDQTYTYENAAVILYQDDGDVMLTSPSITANDAPPSLTIHCVDFEAEGGLTSLGGYGTYPIQTYFLRNETPDEYSEVTNITITSPNYLIWENYFENLLQQEAFESSSYQITNSSSYQETYIKFISNFPTLTVDTTTLGIQFAPGWVE